MARATSKYVCQNCGASYPKWSGKCDACGEWNTLVEEQVADAMPKGLGKAGGGRKIEFVALSGVPSDAPRRMTGIQEFDRVCGGGLVHGSALLVGGDPGIGKSTLLLQATCCLAQETRCAYISGEEAVDQVRMRASRLGLANAPVQLASANNVRDIVASLEAADGPQVAVIDSIQTMYIDNLDSAPGTVAQVRACSAELIRVAKRKGITLLIVGHVTKDGQIAGPRVLEHMVDTVLYFEGERGHQFRILRAVKNRFGATDEIGVFEMGEDGLVEVPNPSELFLADRRRDITGTAVFAGLEGTRPVPADAVVFGEIGLSGDIRAVSQTDQRLKEAAKLGFNRALMPQPRRSRGDGSADGLRRVELDHLSDLLPLFQADVPPRPPRRDRD